MLLDRIYEEVNKKLTPNQAGFQKGMNCLQQIYTFEESWKGPEIRIYHYSPLLLTCERHLIR